MKKNLFKCLFVLLMSVIVMTACGSDSDDAGSGGGDSPTRIVVADARTTHHLNLYVAYELGLFEQYNLDVEIVTTEDNAASRDLLVSGGADVFWTCPTVAIAAIANGAPIRTIAQVKTPCTSVLMVPRGSDINRLEDLQGRDIAGISPACEAVLSLAVAARNAGAEFNLQTMGGGPAIIALEGDSVEGAILEEPHASIAELAGFEMRFADISSNIPCRTINAREAFISNNADALADFIRAIDEANEIILADPTAERIVEIAVSYTGAPEEAVINGNHRLIFGTRIEVDGLIALGDELLNIGNISENPRERMFSEAFRGNTW